MSNLRDEVAAAFDKVVDEAPEPVESVEAAESTEATEATESVEANEAVESTEATEVTGAATATEATAATTSTSDAPASWTAAEKASWAKIPADLKAPILRREKEIREGVRVDGTTRKFADSINQTIKPYEALLSKTGLTPAAVMQESLQLAQSMNTGTPQEKAETLGKMIMHFGVDIDALDKYLVDPKNASASRTTQTPAYDPTKDPALSPLFSLAKQVQARTEEANAKLIQEAESWPGFEEARAEMGDLLEWADSRGQKMTLGQAYTRITGNQPPSKATVTPITDAAKPSQKSVSDAAAILARSRKAASSVAGNQRTPPAVDTDDIRATVAAAANGLL